MIEPRDESSFGDAGGPASVQHERLIDAVASSMARSGYAALTVAQIAAAAGISRSSFYEHFETKLDAVLVAHEATFEPFLESLSQVCGQARDWPTGVTSAIGAALDYASAHPDRAQLLTVETITLNAELARRMLDSANRLADLLRGGRQLNPATATLPALTEKALVGGISAVVFGRLLRGEAESLPTLKRELAEIALLPYVGPEAAARIATEQS